MSGALEIATMSRHEVELATGLLAAAEGWNAGVHDAATFHAADPDGFLVGRLDGAPVGCISAASRPWSSADALDLRQRSGDSSLTLPPARA